LAAFDAYDHIIGEQYDRIELAVAKAQKEEHDAKAKEQQDNLDLVVRFANQTSVENATLVTKYNELVNQYNVLVTDNRNLHDLAQQAINLGQRVINAYSDLANQPVYPTLPAVSTPLPAQPLSCTARTFDLGVGMQTTYMNCH
jgi:predicted transcriptional regulator